MQLGLGVILMSQSVQNQSTECLFEIIQEVAKIEQVDPVDLPSLHDSVDPEALTDIVNSSNEDLRIQFSYYGYEVGVTGNGSVAVEV